MDHLALPQPHSSTRGHHHLTISRSNSTTSTLVGTPSPSDSQLTLAESPKCMSDPPQNRSLRDSRYLAERSSKVGSRVEVKQASSCKERVFLASFVFLDVVLGIWSIYCAVRYIVALGKSPDYVVQRRCAIAFAILSIFSALILVISLIFVYLRRRPSYLLHQLMLLVSSLSLIAPGITGVAIVSDAIEGKDILGLLGRCRQDEDVLWSSEGTEKCIPGVSLGSWMVGVIFRLVVTLIFLVALHSILHALRHYWDFEERPTSEFTLERPTIKPLFLTPATLSKSNDSVRHSLGFVVNIKDQSGSAPSKLYSAAPPPLPSRNRRPSAALPGAQGTQSSIAVGPSKVVTSKPPVTRQQSASRSDKEGSDPDTEISEAHLEVAVVQPASRYDRPRYYEIAGPSERQSAYYSSNYAPASPPPPPPAESKPRLTAASHAPVVPLLRTKTLGSQTSPSVFPPSSVYLSPYAATTSTSTAPAASFRRTPPAPAPVYYHRYNSQDDRSRYQRSASAQGNEQDRQKVYMFGGAAAVSRMNTIASHRSAEGGSGSRTGTGQSAKLPLGPSATHASLPYDANRRHRQAPLGPRSRT